MNKGRGWILILLGLALAIGAGVLVFVVLKENNPENIPQNATPQIATVRVPIASGPLAIGTTISPTSYNVVDYPINLVPVNAITDTTQLDGKVLVQFVDQGETFSSNVFLGAESAPFSQQVEPGNVLMAFPVQDLLSQVDVIQDGDHIDLLLTSDFTNGANQTAIHSTLMTVQNIQVLQVLRSAQEDGKKGEPRALLLNVTPEDAVAIKYVKDLGGTFDFVLRSSLETKTFQVSPLTTSEFLERYGLNQ